MTINSRKRNKEQGAFTLIELLPASRPIQRKHLEGASKMTHSFLQYTIVAAVLLFVLCVNCAAEVQRTALKSTNQILFVCTGNYYRSRFAEALFNQEARVADVHWKAMSRGLVLVPSQHGISSLALRELKHRGVSTDECNGTPKPLTQEDLDQSDYIVLMDEAEHRAMFEKQFPNFDENKIHFWHILDGRDNSAQACQLMSNNVSQLIRNLRR
jgi:protein-tyrosine phosphatase